MRELVPVSHIHRVVQNQREEQSLPILVWGGEGFPFLLLKLFSLVGKSQRSHDMSLEIRKPQLENALSNMN